MPTLPALRLATQPDKQLAPVIDIRAARRVRKTKRVTKSNLAQRRAEVELRNRMAL